ncbi:MAG TPA: hypothetical protein VH141_15200 [Pseudonocardia sp.]|jgi:hypothetical protein|nr:hypothetical protein [Pseudonocardia sp.]
MAESAPEAKYLPPCPPWCHTHWSAGTGRQHLSIEVRYTSGVVQLERLDTETTEGPISVVIEPTVGESLVLAASDTIPLIGALYAVMTEAGR